MLNRAPGSGIRDPGSGRTGNWKLETRTCHRGGMALNVFSMFSSSASVERTPASR